MDQPEEQSRVTDAMGVSATLRSTEDGFQHPVAQYLRKSPSLRKRGIRRSEAHIK